MENRELKKNESVESTEYVGVDNNSDTEELKNLIMRLALDDDFKQLLIQNPDKALEEYQLNEMQKVLIRSLDEEDIEKLSPENIDEFFAADSAVYTPEYTDEEAEESDEDDI